MSDLNTLEQEETKLSTYKQLKQQAAQLNSQVNAWNGQFDTFRATLDATDQATLDAKKTEFINALKASLGI